MTAPILVMGATSGIGKLAVEEALDLRLPVRAFARGADALTPTDLLEPFPGDALSEQDVTRALSGTQAVIYALGIRERLSWRRDRDSNPGDGFPPTHFPGVRLRPLGHLSVGRSPLR
jgi:uncharacterized protein YbjT (DUF2867 family)